MASGLLRSRSGGAERCRCPVGGDPRRGLRPTGVILCDTGPIVAAALVGDDHHHECVELFTGLHMAGRSLLVPGTVVAEVGYMLAREAGARVESLFLSAVADGDFELMGAAFGDAFDFTGADFASWCKEAGFREVEVLPLNGPTSAGIAYK